MLFSGFMDNSVDKIAEPRRKLGDAGELLARSYLQTIGIEIECCNYRTRVGEIDIIGWDRDTLVFYEVRTLSSHRFLPDPILSITKQKFIRLKRLATQYMIERFGRYIVCRIDLVTVVGTHDSLKINSITCLS